MGKDIFDMRSVGKFKIGTKGMNKPLGKAKITDIPLSGNVKAGKISDITTKGLKRVTNKKRTFAGIGKNQGKSLLRIAKTGRV